MIKISPSFSDTDFTSPYTFEEKARIFYDRIIGWQFDIAEKIINGKKRPSGEYEIEPLQHSGFAVLYIVLSYFETIAKYQDGYRGTSKAGKYFKKGVKSIFPNLSTQPQNIIDDLLDTLYKGVRCGLYHSAAITSKVGLTGGTTSAFVYDVSNLRLFINPHKLVAVLKAHLDTYMIQLQNLTNTQLRRKFETRFDFEGSQ